MPVALDFEWDSADLAVFRGRKVDTALARALRLGGNQAIRVVQRAAIAHITGRKLLRDADVKKGLPLVLPRRSDAIQNLSWTMKVSGRPIALSKFPNVDTRSLGKRGGVLVRVNRGAGPVRIASAFSAGVASGHVGIFRRKGKARYPLQHLVTSSLADSMQDAGVAPAALAKGYAKLEAAWPKGMDRELGKLRRKGAL
jgi:hypothetical protein